MLRGRVLVLAAAALVVCGGPAGEEARGDAAGEPGAESAGTMRSETVVLIVPSQGFPVTEARRVEGSTMEMEQ